MTPLDWLTMVFCSLITLAVVAVLINRFLDWLTWRSKGDDK